MTRSYRHEWLVLVLLGVTAFTFFHRLGPQDVTRLALSQSLADHGSLRIDRWHRQTIDKALYEGRYYADKAPGISFLAAPSWLLLRATGVIDDDDSRRGVWRDRGFLWAFRVLTGGLGFLAVVFLVGRVAEGIAANTGAATATAFGLGTLALPLAATMFQHVMAAALGFAAFVAAWSGARATRGRDVRWAASGLCAGLAVLVEYQTVVIAAVLLVYAASRGARAALVYVAAGLPCALTLAAYNTAAFDSPLHLSYSYVGEQFARQQSKGLFGIGVPDPVEFGRVLGSWDGLLVQSPVLVLGGVGLALLWREGVRAEAAVCGTIVVLFLALNAGYYDPIGGLAPGPRFFIPALPFLAVGLPCAFRRWPFLTLGATAISVGVMLYRAGTWARPGSESFVTVWSLLGAPRLGGVLVVGVLALAALILSGKGVLASGTPTRSSVGIPLPRGLDDPV
jgi:hypothetical protein